MVVSSLMMASLAEKRQQNELEIIIFLMRNMKMCNAKSGQALCYQYFAEKSLWRKALRALSWQKSCLQCGTKCAYNNSIVPDK